MNSDPRELSKDEPFKVGESVYVEHRGWGPVQWTGPVKVKTIKKRPRVLLLEGDTTQFDYYGHLYGTGYSSVTQQLHRVSPEVLRQVEEDNLRATLIKYCWSVRDGNYVLEGSVEDMKAMLQAMKKVCRPKKK